MRARLRWNSKQIRTHCDGHSLSGHRIVLGHLDGIQDILADIFDVNGDLRMRIGKDSENLIGKGLTDGRDPFEIKRHKFEIFDSRKQSLGLRSGDQAFVFILQKLYRNFGSRKAPVHCCKPIKNGSQFCSGVIVDRHFHQGPLEMGKLRESRQQITRLVGRMRKYQAVRKNNEPAARSAGKKRSLPQYDFQDRS